MSGSFQTRGRPYLPWFLLMLAIIYILHAQVPLRQTMPVPCMVNPQAAAKVAVPDQNVADKSKPPPVAVPAPVVPAPAVAAPPIERPQWTGAQAQPFFGDWRRFESLFCFGDSYTATLFDVHGEQPRVGHPLGNHDPAHPLLRNWPTFMTLNHNASFLKTYNFAIGGSTVNRKLSPPFMMGSTFKEEAELFVDAYASVAPRASWNPTTSLFVVLFGVNDLILPRFAGRPDPPIPAIFKSYTDTFVKLYNAGARNFIVMTVPPAYRSVDNLDFNTLLAVAEDMASFNSRIFEMKSILQNKYPEARFATFDAHSFWARVIETPTDFEETKMIGNSTAVCETVAQQKKKPLDLVCQDGTLLREHVWTSLHGTYSIHNATSARIVRDCLGPRGKIGYCS